MKKIANVLATVFGYGIALCLFAGAAVFLGYAAALIVGGETAAEICTFIYKGAVPVMIKVSTVTVLLGLVVMYLRGETALTSEKRKK